MLYGDQRRAAAAWRIFLRACMPPWRRSPSGSGSLLRRVAVAPLTRWSFGVAWCAAAMAAARAQFCSGVARNTSLKAAKSGFANRAALLLLAAKRNEHRAYRVYRWRVPSIVSRAGRQRHGCSASCWRLAWRIVWRDRRGISGRRGGDIIVAGEQ